VSLFQTNDLAAPATGIVCNWQGSASRSESALHQISPYIGKLKSTIAAALVTQFTEQGDVVYDPFCGCGTVALEAWAAGRRTIAADLNPYAHLLTRAKLSPYTSLQTALKKVEIIAGLVINHLGGVDLRSVPKWIREFFHSETLREIIAWNQILQQRELYFLQACLFGILHHQRPGFLSYPSCHTVPYLRTKKFPRQHFPTLYAFRPLRCRLESKIRRALSRVPELDLAIDHTCFLRDAAEFIPGARVDAIITSPPYMRRLNYARDNRLRLWFLGVSDWKELDMKVSPREADFVNLMRQCFALWKKVLSPTGRCVLILGDSYSRLYRASLPDAIIRIAVNEIGGYRVVSKHTEKIPDLRRVRRGLSGNRRETILVLERRSSTRG
jgi:hypothetical protein